MASSVHLNEDGGPAVPPRVKRRCCHVACGSRDVFGPSCISSDHGLVHHLPAAPCDILQTRDLVLSSQTPLRSSTLPCPSPGEDGESRKQKELAPVTQQTRGTAVGRWRGPWGQTDSIRIVSKAPGRLHMRAILGTTGLAALQNYFPFSVWSELSLVVYRVIIKEAQGW